MSQELREVRRLTYARYCDWRAIDRLLSATEFEDAWNKATTEQRASLSQLLQAGSREQVSRWLKDILKAELPNKSLRELRIIAKHQGIPLYSGLSKDQLVDELGGKK